MSWVCISYVDELSLPKAKLERVHETCLALREQQIQIATQKNLPWLIISNDLYFLNKDKALP